MYEMNILYIKKIQKVDLHIDVLTTIGNEQSHGP